MNPITESSMVSQTLVDDRSRALNGSAIDRRLVEPAGAHEPARAREPARANKPVMRLLVTTLILVAALFCGVVFGLYKMRVDIPALKTTKIYAHLDSMERYIVGRYHSYFQKHDEAAAHHEEDKIVVTSPMVKDVIITQQFVCQIHSRNHIDVCALEDGYLMPIKVKEGQAVKEGDVLFEIVPAIYKAKFDAAVAERDLAKLELGMSQGLANNRSVSPNEVKLFGAKLARAQANADQAEAELKFTRVTARFDGIIDRQKQQQGSLVKEGDILTTLSDISVMWVYFNVPEAQYLEYKTLSEQEKKDRIIELELANHNKFPRPASALTIEGQFNNQTGTIMFRADFENPDTLLRHGQTGTILIHRPLKNAVVIPQRATFELLDKRYVWVLDKDDVAHQKLITIKHELEDVFVINTGLDVNDKIVLEGVRQVAEGGKVDYEFREPAEALKNQKFRAE
jgi:membrane fusion protein, multidrug efflux system